MGDAVQTGGQNQPYNEIWVACGVRPAQLHTAQVAAGAGQTHQLAAVLAAPAYVQRRFVRAQACVGIGDGIAESRQLPGVGQDACHKMPGLAVGGQVALKQVFAVADKRHIYMQAVAAAIGQGLGHKAGVQAVAAGNGFDSTFKSVQIVGGLQRRGVAEADLVLARAALVVAVLGLQAHLLDGQADVAADVLALVQRRDVKIAAVVQRNVRRIAIFVGFK